MDLDIDGNAALVTASSSGLGKASARALAREGANVVVNGRDEDRLAAAAEELREDATGEVVAQPGDLTDPDHVRTLVERTVSEFGGLDHLVTSAGGPPRHRFPDATDEAWYEAYDLLVMSVVRLVREAADHLSADGGGTIVNITSRVVKEATPTNVLSSSVRMGVIGLEKTLTRELGPEVRANAVLPGAHETPRIGDPSPAEREAATPLERIGDPMELGNTVAFLCSPLSGYVNGQAIVIDGGSGASNL